MPQFRYRAVSSDGELQEGEITALNQSEVIGSIHELGHTPLHIEEVAGVQHPSKWFFLGHPGQRIDITSFTRDLNILLNAGIPLDRALEMLSELSEKPAMALMIQRLLDEVQGGAALADAMEAQQGVFSRFYVNMVRAAEAAGALEAVLDRLTIFMERSDSLKNAVKTALIYPSILVFVTVISFIILMTFVIPQFASMFEGMGAQLPMPSRIVLGVAEVFRNYWWGIVALLLMVVIYVRQRLTKPGFRYKWDKRILRLPLVGELVTKIDVAIFSRTLATLLSNGVPLLAALSIVRETLNNHVLKEVVDSVAESARNGEGLAKPLLTSGCFPTLTAHLVRVGEESGELESTLFQMADIYDAEIKTVIKRILVLVEPVLIIGLGIVIGAVIMSILAAILSINELAF